MLRTRLRDRASSGGGSTVVPLRVVETQGRVATSRNNNAGIDRFAFRFPYLIGADASAIVASFSNWYLDVSSVLDTGNDFTILELSAHSPTGVVVPMTYSGGRSELVANGTTDVKSDEILATAFSGFTKLTRGEIWWLKGIVSVPSLGGYVPYTTITTAEYSGTQQVGYSNAATTPSSTDAAGQYTVASGAAFTTINVPRPILLGRPLSDGKSYFVVGDSIADGQGDDATANGIYGRGFLARAMSNYGANPYPCLIAAKPGAESLAFSSSTAKWGALAAYGKYAIDELGTNDVTTAVPVATTQSRLSSVWSTIAAQGASRIYRTDLICRTTSTDSWATAANQTAASGWGSGEARDQLNAWFATKVSDSTLYQILTMNSLKDGTDNHKWKTDGVTANYLNADISHPTRRGHGYLASEVRTFIDSDLAYSLSNYGSYSTNFDATDTSTTPDAGSGEVSTWTDIGPAVKSAGPQATTTDRPHRSVRTINSLAALDFDGSDWLTLPNDFLSATPTTVFMGFIPDSVDTTVQMVSNGGTSGASTFVSIRNQACNFGNTTLARSGAVTSGSYMLQVASVNVGTGSGRQQLVINGAGSVAFGTVNRATPDTQWSISSYARGGGGKFNGALAQIITFNRELTYIEMNAIAHGTFDRFGGTWTDLTI